jgi:nucleotide-binding universal stress UspA family protein
MFENVLRAVGATKKMAKAQRYLVPLDFSKGSEIALDYAVAMARKNKARLTLLHVVPAATGYPSEAMQFDLYSLMERDAREDLARLMKKKKLNSGATQILMMRGTNPAEVIARQAKKHHANMIIMGSHGRTGLGRLLLGSVAEKTLRLASCPVLIVKK